MRISISYSARSNHLKQLAEIIFMKFFNNIKYLGTHSPLALEADILFVGFTVEKGICDKDMASFSNKLTDKKIFLFGLSGWDDPEYWKSVLKKTTDCIAPSNQILGTFMCQEAVSRKQIEEFKTKLQENPKDETMIYHYNMLRSSVGHPDKEDIRNFISQLNRWQEKFSL